MSDFKSHKTLSVDVFQLGARMHYAVPLMFERAGMLRHFYTDVWKTYAERKYGWVPGLKEKVKTRFDPDLPLSKIKSCDLNGIRYAMRLKNAQSRSDETRAFLDMGSYFSGWVEKQMKEAPDVIYGFNSASQELFASPKTKSSLKVLEQTLIPRSVERTILADEFERRHFAREIDLYSLEYERRESAEWKLADIIICGSEFVKQSLLLEAVPEEKLVVIPYGYDAKRTSSPKKKDKSVPLRLLFVGNGWLRKGLLYLLEAVAELKESTIEVHIAGKSDLEESLLEPFSDFTTIHGVVGRDKMVDLYEFCDVFVLPSLCEGSATVVYEAMSYGLPVICTHNSGSVIRHNVDGYIVNPQRVEELGMRIHQFLTKPEKIEQMSVSALEWSAQFTTLKYQERLLDVINQRSQNTEIRVRNR